MLPVDVVLKLEALVFDVPTDVLRIFVGIVCLMTHGLKRWADVQHTKSVEMTADALVLTCYRSKRKVGTMTWGALRLGFTGKDWGERWFDEWKRVKRGDDFIAYRPTKDLAALRETVADHADATRAMHALLTLCGMEAVEAARFSTHSCRHVLPTAARQLGMPKPERDAMGRWGEGMADYYDSIDCVAEISSQELIRCNIEAGWRPVSRGRLDAPESSTLYGSDGSGGPVPARCGSGSKFQRSVERRPRTTCVV